MDEGPWEPVWSFFTGNMRVSLAAMPELDDPREHFSDERDVAAIESGDVAWFVARVTVTAVRCGPGNALLGQSYLGACAYPSYMDFRRDHASLRGLVSDAIAEARATVTKIRACNIKAAW